MLTLRSLVPLPTALALAAATLSSPALADDYPTAERVTYVQACMRDNPGHYYEMVNKCSCVIDTIARDVSYDDFVSMSTATNASSIGGEQGNALRGVDMVQKQVRQFRTLQAAARKSCMLDGPPSPSATPGSAASK